METICVVCRRRREPEETVCAQCGSPFPEQYLLASSGNARPESPWEDLWMGLVPAGVVGCLTGVLFVLCLLSPYVNYVPLQVAVVLLFIFAGVFAVFTILPGLRRAGPVAAGSTLLVALLFHRVESYVTSPEANGASLGFPQLGISILIGLGLWVAIPVTIIGVRRFIPWVRQKVSF